jgi:putative cell wall-binding protein
MGRMARHTVTAVRRVRAVRWGGGRPRAPMTFLLAAALALVALASPLGTAAAGAREARVRAGTLVRWEGHDRYQVSARVSNTFPVGVARMFVASGEVFTDALSGAPIAARDRAPVLLVRHDQIPSTVREAMVRLKPLSIVVLGGDRTISPGVYADLATLTSGSTTRWSGPDRYAASAAISAVSFTPGVERAYLASGTAFPDALSGAPAAGASPGPILLTAPDALPAAIARELTRLAPKEIVVLGGSATISAAVEQAAAAFTTGSVVRWSGADRFETSAAISRAAFPDGSGTAFVSSGRVFADALSGAPVAGARRAPTLLVESESIPAPIAAELRRLHPQTIVVVGGRASVSDDVFGELSDYLG